MTILPEDERYSPLRGSATFFSALTRGIEDRSSIQEPACSRGSASQGAARQGRQGHAILVNAALALPFAIVRRGRFDRPASHLDIPLRRPCRWCSMTSTAIGALAGSRTPANRCSPVFQQQLRHPRHRRQNHRRERQHAESQPPARSGTVRMLHAHIVPHESSSSRAFAAIKSGVSNPSVNQPYTEARVSYASLCWSRSLRRQASFVAARSSKVLAH